MSNQSPSFHPFSLSSSFSSSFYLRVPSTFLFAHLDNRCPWERKTSHPDNEDLSYPVQIFSSAAVCIGTNGPKIWSFIAPPTYVHIYMGFCAEKSQARECGSRFHSRNSASGIPASSRQWIYARSSGRKLHSRRNANIDFTVMKYRAVSALLYSSCLCNLHLVYYHPVHVSLWIFSLLLIVFIDHVQHETIFRIFFFATC